MNYLGLLLIKFIDLFNLTLELFLNLIIFLKNTIYSN